MGRAENLTMLRLKVLDRRILTGIKAPIKVKGLKQKVRGRIKKALASVHASMAIEGLKPSRVTITLGRQYLEGKISGQEAIARVKAIHLAKGKYNG